MQSKYVLDNQPIYFKWYPPPPASSFLFHLHATLLGHGRIVTLWRWLLLAFILGEYYLNLTWQWWCRVWLSLFLCKTTTYRKVPHKLSTDIYFSCKYINMCIQLPKVHYGTYWVAVGCGCTCITAINSISSLGGPSSYAGYGRSQPWSIMQFTLVLHSLLTRYWVF